jgi:tRNA pseudouridine38-40 synthase
VVRREPTKLTVAGRTDAGVHAWGQVASHPGEPASARSINALLPPDVSVLVSEASDPDFDARRDARSRTYCYRVWTRRERPALLRDRVLWWGHPLRRELLDACAALLVGEHDFRAFTLSDEPYHSYRRRILSAEWIEREGLLEFRVRADSYTRRMVRSLVSYQLDVARGLYEIARFEDLLQGAPRGEGGNTAAASGLYLASVEYR